MTEPQTHPLLDYLDQHIAGLDWRDVLSVRRSIHDYLGMKADQLQAAESTPAHVTPATEGATA